MRILVVFLCLSFFASPAGADQVKPSDRVRNYVNVRQSADANSPSVCIFRPRQTATLLESIPYWYHVKLVDGPPGYMSNETSYALPPGLMARAAQDLGVAELDQQVHWQ